jgi:C4-type Zn-finger protein
MDENKQTVLEGIIEEVSTELYNKWSEALPDAERNQQAFSAMSKNAHETTVFVIQNFMNKFNAAAEELKDQ